MRVALASCTIMADPAERVGAGPGSGSAVRYGGSRLLKQRYQHGVKSRAGLVELRPGCVMTGNQLFDDLANVPGVQRVEWQKPKQAQGNASRNQYM